MSPHWVIGLWWVCINVSKQSVVVAHELETAPLTQTIIDFGFLGLVGKVFGKLTWGFAYLCDWAIFSWLIDSRFQEEIEVEHRTSTHSLPVSFMSKLVLNQRLSFDCFFVKICGKTRKNADKHGKSWNIFWWFFMSLISVTKQLNTNIPFILFYGHEIINRLWSISSKLRWHPAPGLSHGNRIRHPLFLSKIFCKETALRNLDGTLI